MGGVLMKRLQNAYRPVKNFNVEERAFKAISKDKPTPAPTHKRMQEIMQEIKNDPDLLTKGKMDPKTMENLSKVFINSQGDNTDMSLSFSQSTRKLPVNREPHLEYEYGYEDPKKIPQGKMSMRQVLEILGNYETKPNIHTPEKIAQDFKLDINDVNNMLKHFKPFQVHIPAKKVVPRERNPLRLLQNKIDQVKE